MKTATLHLLLAAVALAALAGCSLRRPVAHHAVAYNRAVEDAHNRTALLNVVRSMKRQPQHYTAVTQVVGTASNSLSPSLSLDLESGTATPWTPSADGTRSGEAVVTVSVLDDQDFVQGLLSPITLDQLDFFMSQGWPERLVGLLFVRRIDVVDDDFTHPACAGDAREIRDSTSIYRNLPDESLEDPFERVKCFGARLEHLREREGLRIETRETKSVDVELETASQDQLAELILKADSAGLAVERVGTAAAAGSTSYRLVKKTRAKALVWGQGDDPAEVYVHDSDQAEAYERARNEKGGESGETGPVLLYFRSAQSVAYYLGEIMRAQAASGFTTATPFELLEPKVASDHETALLFAAWKAGPRDKDPLISVEHEGETFVVPRFPGCGDGKVEGCHRSMQVLAIVKQLIGLNKSRDSLSTTAVVKTVGG